MHRYRVSLHEEKGDKFIIHFECHADDHDHAIEQAENAYPNGEVMHVADINWRDNTGMARWRKQWRGVVPAWLWQRAWVTAQQWLEDEPDMTSTQIAEDLVYDLVLDGGLLDGDTWLTDLAAAVDYKED